MVGVDERILQDIVCISFIAHITRIATISTSVIPKKKLPLTLLMTRYSRCANSSSICRTGGSASSIPIEDKIIAISLASRGTSDMDHGLDAGAVVPFAEVDAIALGITFTDKMQTDGHLWSSLPEDRLLMYSPIISC